jgi:hypothetical protein
MLVFVVLVWLVPSPKFQVYVGVSQAPASVAVALKVTDWQVEGYAAEDDTLL